MDTILDNFPSEKLFPNHNLLDLEDLNEADFLSNVHFSENMEDFSNELFSSFFDEHLLAEKNPLLDMELDPPTPDIQAEHSYSLSGDSAPQSPSTPIKMDEGGQDLDGGMWSFGHDLTAILVKQEPNLLADPAPSPLMSPQPLNLAPPPRESPPEETAPKDPNALPAIKAEPKEVNQFLTVPSEEQLQLPPTPPSSHGSDSCLLRQLQDALQHRCLLKTMHVCLWVHWFLTLVPDFVPQKLQGTSGPLMLTEEEKRTLIAEGYPVPNKLPLTKAEEKALKRVRRKIKNKISAQESRRKKKEYVECLEKKVETYTSENNELWKKVETLESANRSLLQQLQKLQALVTGKVPRSCKMASTQTGTCLMVVVVCFVLVLGSFMPCLPELSSVSQTVKSSPLSSADVYTTGQIRSRSLLFYDEGSSLEDRYSALLKMDNAGDWEGTPPDFPEETAGRELRGEHETTKYLSKAHVDAMDLNSTGAEFVHEKEQFHER
ncbi:CR3L1 protein, partial [Amia calva]|nr:CR3L1 protein [Amia calva]